MTPEEFNAVVLKIERALNDSGLIGTVSLGVPADSDGTLPELYVNVDETDLCLTVSPL